MTQDLFFAAETCSRLVVLDGGRVAADGPAALAQCIDGKLKPEGRA